MEVRKLAIIKLTLTKMTHAIASATDFEKVFKSFKRYYGCASSPYIHAELRIHQVLVLQFLNDSTDI